MPRSLLPLLLAAPLAAQANTYALFEPILGPAPAPRERALMAYDEARGRTLMCGGVIGSQVQQQTWEYDGATWTQITPPQQLDFGDPVEICYSPLLGQILAVTGAPTNGGPPMVVHGWTGTSWVVLDANGPPSRADTYAVAWDRSRDVMVMFGGTEYGFGPETWEWDGTSWLQRTFGGPVARADHRMVYDEARQVVVVYGGRKLQPGAHMTDTWEWNGVYWYLHFGIPSPPTSLGTMMVYDSARQRTVLHGGTPNTNGDVYEFDGTAWTALTAFGAPTSMREAAGAFVPGADEIVLFGGSTNTAQGARKLRFVTGTVGASFPHQVGCPGPAGVPTVAAIGSSRPVLGQNFDVAFGNLPNSPISLVIAAYGESDQAWSNLSLPLDLTPLGMTGCSLYVEPFILQPLSNLNGAASWSLLMPTNPVLDGAEFFVQGLVVTPGYNPFGAVMSSSLRGVVGTL